MSAALEGTPCPSWCDDHQPDPVDPADPGTHCTERSVEGTAVTIELVNAGLVGDPSLIHLVGYHSDDGLTPDQAEALARGFTELARLARQ